MAGVGGGDGVGKARLTALVGKLAGAVGIPKDDTVVAVSAAMLAKMVSPYELTKASVQHTQRTLSARATDPARFSSAYAKAKEKNVPGLDRFLMVMARIAAEPDVAEVLTRKEERPPSSGKGKKNVVQEGTGNKLRATDTFGNVIAGEPGLYKSPLQRSGARGLGALGGGGTPGEEIADTSTTTTPPRSSRKPLREPHSRTQDRPAPRSEMPHPRSAERKSETKRTEGVGKRSVDEIRKSLDTFKLEGSIVPDRSRATTSTSFPQLPSWVSMRQEKLLPVRDQGDGDQLATLKPDVQEIALVQEVLTALLGLSRLNDLSESQTQIDIIEGTTVPLRGLNVLLRDQASRLLAVSSDIMVLNAFVDRYSTYSAGLTGQAMAAALRAVLHDWRLMVAQLEHYSRSAASGLSLSSAWFYIQSSSHALKLLAAAVRDALRENIRGASLLDMLEERSRVLSGDQASRRLFDSILSSTSRPLEDFLQKWMYQGEVQDPYLEFMIEENLELKKETLALDYNASYWQKRYVLREGGVPKRLRQHAETILATGKTLNAIRECDNAVLPLAPESSPNRLWEGLGIEEAYQAANRRFHELLFGAGQLIATLESVKRYFLVGQGDFLVHFIDTADHELSKPSKLVGRQKLQTLLELALRTSSAAADPFHDSVTCGLEENGLLSQLTEVFEVDSPTFDDAGKQREGGKLLGYDTFTLDMTVAWPTSLILSRRSLAKYQLLFRHLFHCKHVEQRVAAAWQRLRVLRGSAKVPESMWNAFQGCQLMLHFLQNLLQYITFEVIEPNWHNLMTSLKEAKGVEEVLQHHEGFLDISMKESMLLWPNVLQHLQRLKEDCLAFSQLVAELEPTGADHLDVSLIDFMCQRAEEKVFTEAVAKHLSRFRIALSDIINLLQQSAPLERNLAHLITRLNFNNFFKTRA